MILVWTGLKFLSFSKGLNIQSTLVVSNFAGRGKKLKTAGVRIKNSAIETGSYYRKSVYG